MRGGSWFGAWGLATAGLLAGFVFYSIERGRLRNDAFETKKELALTQTTLARVFVNPERGVLLFANNLPRLESGKVFEMWLVPKSGVPRPAGAFRADDAGGDCGDGAVGGAGERIAGSANAVSGDGCLADR